MQEPKTLSNKQILEKAIQKAIDGGLTGYWADRYKSCKHLDEMEYFVNGNNLEDGKPVGALIFNHDFAKALWGDRDKCICEGEYPKKLSLNLAHQRDCPKDWPYESGYVYHLQAMVISEDPIAYLGANL